MGFRDWVGRYIISIGPPKQDPPLEEVDLADVSLQAKTKLEGIPVQLDESGLKSVPGFDVAFEKVFEAAKIPAPAHPFTLEKISDMLQHPKLAQLTREGKAAAVLVALDSQGVKIESIIEEAVKKDKALDVFEKVQRDHLKQSIQAKEEENQRLAEEIEAITREKQGLIENNKKAMVELQAKVTSWVEKKILKEKEIYDIVQHFTTENPVTVQETQLPPTKVKVTDLTQSYEK